MGAASIEMQIPTGNTYGYERRRNAVVRALAEICEEQEAENGHQDGYSGDWQTVWDMDFSGLRGPTTTYDAAWAKAFGTFDPESGFETIPGDLEERAGRAVVIKDGRKLRILILGLAALRRQRTRDAEEFADPRDEDSPGLNPIR